MPAPTELPTELTMLVYALDMLGVAVFATSGALVASRKQMDVIGFVLLATVTGVGGGTLRDLILDRSVFWIVDQAYLVVCIVSAVTTFAGAHLVQRRYVVLVWMDAAGLAAFGVLGAHIATISGVGVVPAIVLGVMTATFGGLIRDVVSGEDPLILKPEIYATSALVSSCVYVGAVAAGLPVFAAAAAGTVIGFALRAGAIARGWKLPRYRSRAGRSY